MNDWAGDLLLSEVEILVRRAFAEDAAFDDLTTAVCIGRDWQARAEFLVKQDGVITGLRFVPWIFKLFDPKIETRVFVRDGQRCEAGTVLAEAVGPAASLLSAERVALNFVQHLSGVATETALCVKEVEGTGCQILDTRKTILGMRALQKYAVRMGGGTNHRMHLADRILIKDNHLMLAGRERSDALGHCVRVAKLRHPRHVVQVEIERFEELEPALDAGADAVLLDNMSVGLLAQCATACRGRAYLEASGGMTLRTIKEVALTGVNGISMGALTHSARALDISLEMN